MMLEKILTPLLAFAKVAVWLVLSIGTVALIVFLVRYPFASDDPREYLSTVLTSAAVILAAMVVYMGIFLILQSRIGRGVGIAFLGLIVLSKCASTYQEGESRCVESRYISCP